MKVSIITIAYNLPESTHRLVESAMQDADRHEIEFLIFLHSKHDETTTMCQFLDAHYPVKTFYYGTNRGLSRSWNEGLELTYLVGDSEVVIIANDDTYFSPNDIDKLVTKAANCRNNYMVSVAGTHVGKGNKWQRSHGYSCFAINPIALERIGAFDQNLFPIYMEDCDHHRRATLLEMYEENCSDTQVFHGGSSATKHDIRLSRQNIITHAKNSEYYVRKWGGVNERETYKLPFNNKKFSLKIEFADRDHPYGPEFDREDQEIVRI